MITSQQGHATISILCPSFSLAGAAGQGNAIQLLLLPVSSHSSAVPLGHLTFPSSAFTLTLLLPPPPHPGGGKINTSYNRFTTQKDYAPSPLSCSLRQRGRLHGAQPEADFGHGECQVRHGELQTAVKSRVDAGSSHLRQATSSLVTSYKK